MSAPEDADVRREPGQRASIVPTRAATRSRATWFSAPSGRSARRERLLPARAGLTPARAELIDERSRGRGRAPRTRSAGEHRPDAGGHEVEGHLVLGAFGAERPQGAPP